MPFAWSCNLLAITDISVCPAHSAVCTYYGNCCARFIAPRRTLQRMCLFCNIYYCWLGTWSKDVHPNWLGIFTPFTNAVHQRTDEKLTLESRSENLSLVDVIQGQKYLSVACLYLACWTENWNGNFV